VSSQISIKDCLLYEDEYLLVVNKPCGLMVEPDRNNYPNLLHEVKKYLKGNTPSEGEMYAQHIHRLDRPVSGVILFTKQKSVLKNLSEQFAERRVKKYYQALTTNAPLSQHGDLEHWHQKIKKKAVIMEAPSQWSEQARLSYDVTLLSENKFLWNIALHTGKFHQIRAQLAAVDCPIIGDALYGSEILYKKDAIALHACKLIFAHPITNEEMIIEKASEFIQ
jgi:RluA family pseudouridine synthase